MAQWDGEHAKRYGSLDKLHKGKDDERILKYSFSFFIHTRAKNEPWNLYEREPEFNGCGIV